jgi:hypothetical protein
LKNIYQKKYGLDYIINSDNNETLSRIFYERCSKHKIVCNNDELFEYMRTFEEKKGGQLDLF